VVLAGSPEHCDTGSWKTTAPVITATEEGNSEEEADTADLLEVNSKATTPIAIATVDRRII
jgi:hypothetical protein